MSTETPLAGTYVPYEYTRVSVPKNKVTLYRDTYRNFGWEGGTAERPRPGSATTEIEFKRNRDIRNRDEVIDLQRKAQGALETITGLERSRTMVASVLAYLIGIVGAAFLGLSVFATQSDVNVPAIVENAAGMPAVISGAIGIVLWVVAPLVYLGARAWRSARVQPQIDRQFAVVDGACEQASQRLRRVA
ncbi:hypothetical protein [Curtobacterium sp. ZW137]|uniref:hypothetical protein n=1 Tax=Curtobacterium sp. ZW137 TaxID=2485104 RepID=UPI000F4BB3B8|nr:hypothetical protein [Curtobacterium sp. ZW137]ROP66473.1 hypothetical protein EDF55_0929 [Curtobacterium sp. ZW137]